MGSWRSAPPGPLGDGRCAERTSLPPPGRGWSLHPDRSPQDKDHSASSCPWCLRGRHGLTAGPQARSLRCSRKAAFGVKGGTKGTDGVGDTRFCRYTVNGVGLGCRNNRGLLAGDVSKNNLAQRAEGLLKRPWLPPSRSASEAAPQTHPSFHFLGCSEQLGLHLAQ